MLAPEYILKVLKQDCGYNDGESILVGLSGGVDSVALLHLLHSAKIPLAAAHVNYGLRGAESDGDEEFVHQLCADLGVPLYTRRIGKDNIAVSNLQAAARNIRYNFFKEFIGKESMSWIAVAHNSDDQLETVLLNFMRGSGITGMSGMRMANGNIIRPLLNTDRKSIENYCRENRIAWRSDSSNDSDDYLRNKIRHHVVPPFMDADERSSAGWKKTIQKLDATSTLLDELMKPWIERVVTTHVHAFHIDKKTLLEFALPDLLLNYILDYLGFDITFSAEQVDQILHQQPGKKYISGAMRLVVDRDVLVLHGDHQEPWYPFGLIPGLEHEGWLCKEIAPDSPSRYTGFEAVIDSGLLSDNLTVRVWKDADRIQPFGFEGTKKVSDILTEMKLPLNEKEHFPVVTFNQEIVWIPGYRIADKYKVTDKTKTALHIRWNR